jgi:hypothetical protein
MTIPDPAPEVSRQLQRLRDEEDRTHRQRRMTNWIVVCVAVVSMALSSVILIQNHTDDIHIVHNQDIILAHIHNLCAAEQQEAKLDHLPIIPCTLYQPLPTP